MRRAFIPVLMLAGAVAPLGCSLFVASELEDKSVTRADAGSSDAATDRDADASMSLDAFSDKAEASEDGTSDSQEDSQEEDEGPPDAGDCSQCQFKCCDNRCVDTSSDPMHCGDCGQPCPKDRDCLQGECAKGFRSMSEQDAPSPRRSACAVWTGTELFVWGGTAFNNLPLGDGGAYDPITDSWRPININGAPSARGEPNCVAMGTDVFVWGGSTNSGLVDGGAIWSSTQNTWKAIDSHKAPKSRRWPAVVWTGERVLVWGGQTDDGKCEQSGSQYDPVLNTWNSMSDSSSPKHCKRQAYAWMDTLLYVYGGRNDNDIAGNKLHSYDPATDVWKEVNTITLAARSNSFITPSDSRLLVWSGFTTKEYGVPDGFVFDPSTCTWKPLTSPQPSSIRGRVPFRSGWCVWTGDAMLLVGGVKEGKIITNSITYNPNTKPQDQWSKAIPWDPPLEYDQGIGVWTGTEFILWGGSDGSKPILGGSRWMP
ncbi:MAG TPA: hypothetical protein PKL73_17100 [Polyangiaceae bacterium]|jgi:N-acetylneuraminic acid mutarotase|nr:MAG: N-acetylneuraminate epimerase [Deltaproteobacteria bacterium ADurb.Bin207]HNS98675.1 hypothetical protein [Polyangiaceae bacterium]HNZ23692.1 hypothetical protein [Polyangiaceae bacterium]HOD23402.1 hypothetical protein [Polyangiaceae bacterium]HOE49606.1 hypothetical protein [Polyangiaceae bacterium]